MTLITDADNSEIVVDLEFTNCFKPMYAITCHKAQGVTINQPYSMYEYKRMKHDMLYVCLARASKQDYANFCDIECHKPYTGYIYTYSYNDICYIGCTTDIKQRLQKHRDNTTNTRGRALTTYGYDNFQFELLETVQFSERQELYDIEDAYMIQFDSINTGYNTRIHYES